MRVLVSQSSVQFFCNLSADNYNFHILSAIIDTPSKPCFLCWLAVSVSIKLVALSTTQTVNSRNNRTV